MQKGIILGAIKVGRDWQIPDDAVRPADGRVSSGKYAKKKDVGRKPLPIKEFLNQKPLVSLFTRPRRFGKTLNMDTYRLILM
ncbi:MAG: hypothetical protein J6K43_05315 [Lachnospiraceae bacterium]|nr:hypothetical protein [Lachnospiraceae bacterium]